MRPEIKRQGPVVDKWIDPIGKRIEVNRDEGVRIGAAADDRTQSQFDGVRRRARHHDVGSALHQKLADSEADLQHRVAFVESRWTGGASGWMSRIDRNGQAAKR